MNEPVRRLTWLIAVVTGLTVGVAILSRVTSGSTANALGLVGVLGALATVGVGWALMEAIRARP
ncbi:MAG: hypothetical protein ACRCZP_06550 [Phycicoccus sp.]